MKDIPVPSNSFRAKGYRKVLMPFAVFSLFLLEIIVLCVTTGKQGVSFFERNILILFILGLLGSLYGLVLTLIYYKEEEYWMRRLDWLNLPVVGISLGVIASTSPLELIFAIYILFVLNMLGFALVFPRKQIYWTITFTVLTQIYAYLTDGKFHIWLDWIQLFTFPLLALIVAETVLRLKNTIAQHANRLETINSFFHKISSSLDEDEVQTWLKEAIQDSIKADTYYLALVNGSYLDLGLFYDDGEYFDAVKVPIEGTLGGWVICHHQTLFLNDLRKEPNLEGVKIRIIGKKKISLSWIGVPVKTDLISGMLGVGSYSPLAFTQSDVDFLESLSQQAALALNNARQHQIVKKQAQTDSLTGVYNHGYFLEKLTSEMQKAHQNKTSLSLIMIDVDYFKKYNDSYGHLIGDEVLQIIAKTIRRFIKSTDSVGRWGGEEFVISLPNATGKEALQVAARIQESLRKMQITIWEEKDIPVPTISQGIAEFPTEAQEVFKLIDLADRRLYVAKERGRNQIEPNYEPDFANNMLC